MDGRCITGCNEIYSSYAHGTKNSALISIGGHTPAHCAIYKGQKVGSKDDVLWKPGQSQQSG